MDSLRNLCVMVTRPDPAGQELCELIDQCGGIAVHFPTIAVLPPADPEAFGRHVNSLSQQHWLIFISPQAVYAMMAALRNVAPHFSATVKFAAVGAGTAQALEEAGYPVAACPAAEWSSEGLLALSQFHSVQNKKVAIISGEGGRGHLAETLKARGAEVTVLLAYQRGLPQGDIDQYLALLKQDKIDIIMCASFTAIANLKILCGDLAWLHLKNRPLLVVSERIKLLAGDLGFQTIWVASNASHRAVIDKLTFIALKKEQSNGR